MAVVSGTIIFSNPSIPISADIKVQAFDKDMRSEQLLGEVIVPKPPSSTAPVFFTITYSESRFRRNEKHSADLIIRVQTVDGSARGESGLIFNAPDEVLNLRIRLNPVQDQLSEFERLVNELTPLMEGVEPADLTEADIGFLSKEAQEQVKRIQFWREAAKLERETGIRVEAGYGWQRMSILPLTIERLLEESHTVLQKALGVAITQNIIPDVSQDIDDILDRLDALQIETERQVAHTFVGQLLNIENNQPLSNYTVKAEQSIDNRALDLGEDITERGFFSFTFYLLRSTSTNGEPSTTDLRLTILSPDGEEIDQATVTAIANSEEIQEVRIRVPLAEEEISAPVEEVVSSEVTALLHQNNFTSLSDVRSRLGDLEQIDGLSQNNIEILTAHANLEVLTGNTQERATLIDSGLRSIASIAQLNRSRFVAVTGDHLNDAHSARLYREAQIHHAFLQNAIAQTRVFAQIDPNLVNQRIALALPQTPCDCEDCRSAVSPAAYLTDLIQYVTHHLEDDGDLLTLPQLESRFHQPFGRLRLDCQSVEEEVRQVRLCIEVLRRFLGLLTSENNSNQRFLQAQQNYLQTAYTDLLTRIGTSYDEIRRIPQEVEARQTLAERLGIAENHLNALFFDLGANSPALQENNLERVFGLRDTHRDPLDDTPVSQFQQWRLAHLRSLWQQQDHPSDDPFSRGELPIIDPDRIVEGDFRHPEPGNSAFELWAARQQEVTELQNSLMQLNPEENGLEPLLAQVYGNEFAAADTILTNIQNSINLDEVKTWLKERHLTLEGFIRLMEIRALAASGTRFEESIWQEAVNILVQVQKQRRYTDWIAQEQGTIELSVRQFWLALEEPKLISWRASTGERQLWQQMLQRNSQPSLITPYLINPANFVDPENGNPAFDLWQTRFDFAEQRRQALQSVRETAANSLQGLENLFNESTLGLAVSILPELANLETSGQSISARLQQLGLSRKAYVFLRRLHQLAVENSSILDSEWAEAYNIFYKLEEQLLYSQWRQQEQDAGITLSPDFFTIPDTEPELKDFLDWLSTWREYKNWKDALEARIEQKQTVIDALQAAISATEEATLLLLRDALVMAAPQAAGRTLEAKAKWLSDRLLIDTQTDACSKTTRVGFAITTLQLLLWSVRTGQLQDTFPDLELDADYFDEEWKWLGSYATWRSAMFVFLYPENVLQPNLRPYQTPVYQSTTRKLPARLTPETACAAAKQYAQYFRDITSLRPEVSCQARTRIAKEDPCKSTAVINRQQLYMVARAQESGAIYWSTYTIDHPDDEAQSFWQRLEAFENVEVLKLVGIMPMEARDGTDKLYLFAKIWQGQGHKLVFVTYNLDSPASGWSSAFITLDLPGGLSEFDVITDQLFANQSAQFVLSSGGRLGFVRHFSTEKDGWEGDNFEPIELHRSYTYLRALLTTGGDSLLLIGQADGDLFLDDYRRNHQSKWALMTDIDTDNNNRTILRTAEIGRVHGKQKEWIGAIKTSHLISAELGQAKNIYVFWRHRGRTYFAYMPDTTTQLSASRPRVFSIHLTRIAYDASATQLNINRRLFIERTSAGKIYRALFRVDFPNLRQITIPAVSTKAVAPQVKEPRNIPAKLDGDQLQLRRLLIENTVKQNQDFPLSNLVYLQEAYYFLPIHLALQLQKVGHYGAALDWFRTVYDYAAPRKRRKIYYGLVQEESLDADDRRSQNWLQDPLNPHRIAESRPNTYTYYTLLSLIRCLLDYADAEFTRDTAESNERARTLYLTALELLDDSKLVSKPNSCRELQLGINLNVRPNWQVAYQRLLASLRGVRDPRRLAALTRQIQAVINQNELAEAQRFTQVRQMIRRELEDSEPRQTVADSLNARTETLQTLQQAAFAQPHLATTATRLAHQRGEAFMRSLSAVSGVDRDNLERTSLPWLRQRASRNVSENGSGIVTLPPRRRVSPDSNTQIQLAFLHNPIQALNVQNFQIATYIPPVNAVSFCIPENPVPKSLKLRAESNLYKLRHCLNIAGMRREVEPYAAPIDANSGLPQIGSNGQLILPGIPIIQPTPYRYVVLVERAKELVSLAQQIESAFLAALEKRDQAAFTRLQARQNVEMTTAKVQLQRLRVDQARKEVTLTELQRDRTQIQVDTYQQWIEDELNTWEEAILEGYETIKIGQIRLAGLTLVTQIANTAVTAATADYSAGAAAAAFLGFSYAAGLEFLQQSQLIEAESRVKIAQAQADFERRKQEWEFQEKLALQDLRISDQQIRLAEDNLQIVGQEYEISEFEADYAKETLTFLDTQFTNIELYEWMSDVLEGVYSYFLQQATSIAKLAEVQLASERQEVPPQMIQSDYWNITIEGGGFNESAPDRRGLTGSARLLQDLYQLDQYAFQTKQRKLELTKTISLASLAPAEFQAFREAGILRFDTPMELFDRDFPGHYLRLIQRVRTSIIALIPPIEGVHATLSATGLSRVVIGNNGFFQKTQITRSPESIAFTTPSNATGLFELTPQSPEMLLPFEGMGVDTTWEFSLPKATNRFDYRTIADVLITFEYTALNSFTYRQQVIQDLRDTVSADLAFSFRNELADQWYDLNNPDQTATPMVVRFQTRREDFPSNIQDLKIQQVVLYFVRQDGADFEVPVTHLHFTERNGIGTVGGGAQSIDGIISTRRGNAASWTAMIGKSPFGDWELALLDELDDGQRPRELFENEEIEDILLVITYAGRTPEWPV